MKTLGYYNGKFDELDKMTVPMNDRACWFGDGVYDAGLARNHKIFILDEHIDRLFNSAKMLEIEIPVSKDELRSILCDMVNKLDDPEQFVYFQVTRGTAPRNHVFPDGKGNLWIMLKPQKLGDCNKKIKLITEPDTRFFHCNIKTINLIPACDASEKAKRAGCGEAVLYRPGGRVTECAHSNVSIIKNGTLITAPLDNLILPGITRAHLIGVCKKLGIPVEEKPYTLDELYNADEIIVSSSTKLCVGADEIDKKPAGGKSPELLNAIITEIVREFEEDTAI